MDSAKRHATAAQVTAMMDFMQGHADVAKGGINSELEREGTEARWQHLTSSLNSMGGAVKSIDKWKQTWRDLKTNTTKKATKRQQPSCETSRGLSSESSNNISEHIDDGLPSKKRQISFDEEIINIEREKLEFDREYKIQKIEVLSRIASALEELAKKH